uniref:glyoxal reductase n=1 Tax=Oncorhynchus gorbuscha TaxID=8017 RepID=UPI001EAF3F64|nr:glyoxal reductase [Oncorhynchus gorbuscha]XP_046188672.1 glyoxal reductase [Oncorhynchus gorbuscha]XP_046188673.1 glyoxal reductase [Oncorhynchus gorbuscha]XP_046188674.1 glyoxal reductase [Oncorhynchus gorbuscha]
MSDPQPSPSAPTLSIPPIHSSPTPSVLLNTGARMPLLGLGTYRLRGPDEILQAVDAALSTGYRSFDTASVYRNEADLGRALRRLLPEHGLSRADVFITSKLGPKDQASRARDGALRSLELLDLDYIDLYLIHWPGTQGLGVGDKRNPENRAQSWAVLEELHAQGKLRAIGVSNYTPGHMKELLEACCVTPAVLQVEFHPRLSQGEMRHLCGEKGVCFQAYSSLGTGSLLQDPLVVQIAQGYGLTTAQVLLRWAVQQGVPVLPKSSHPTRVAENGRVFDFELTAEDMERLGGMDCGQKYCWDPSQVA